MAQPAEENKEEKVKEKTTRSIKIAFIRHAEAMNNVDSYYWEVQDTWLTNKGEKSIQELKKRLEKTDFYNNIELVISSPLLRTLQTSFGIFEGTKIPLMVNKDISEVWSCACDEGTKKSELLKKKK
eukprot:69572_1